MPYNGSGVFTLVAGNPVVTGTVISSTVQNNTMSDIANNGLTLALTKDGQQTPTANIPMGGFQLTGVGNATTRDAATNAGQIQDGSFQWLTAVAGTDTITASSSSPSGMSAYVGGQSFRFVAASTNTTPSPTLNINSIGAKNITRSGSVSLSPGDIPAGAVIEVVYDGTQFQMIPVVALTHGACRLNYVSTSALSLVPYNGNGLIINGSMQAIPSAGVTCSSTGTTNVAFYYIYAYMNSGVMALEFSTTGHSTNTNGVEIKSGDATRTLVGAAFVQNSGAWLQNSTFQCVSSWFNRREKILSVNPGTAVATTQNAYVEMGSTYRLGFINWNDESTDIDITGSAFAAGACSAFIAIGLDTVVQNNGSAAGISITSSGIVVPLVAKGSLSGGEGVLHTASLYSHTVSSVQITLGTNTTTFIAVKC